MQIKVDRIPVKMARTHLPPVETEDTRSNRGRFTLVERDSAQRSQIEACIRSGYGMHFGACIEDFMPRLVHYQHPRGCMGVIGIRSAGEEPLFLETYLSQPIQTIFKATAGYAIPRQRIAEVGQFVVGNRVIASDFFHDLIPFLIDEGFEYVCFTATNQIRSILSSIGFRGLELAAADARLIQDSIQSWGRYYDKDPVIIIGKLDDPLGGWCDIHHRHHLTLKQTG